MPKIKKTRRLGESSSSSSRLGESSSSSSSSSSSLSNTISSEIIINASESTSEHESSEVVNSSSNTTSEHQIREVFRSENVIFTHFNIYATNLAREKARSIDEAESCDCEGHIYKNIFFSNNNFKLTKLGDKACISRKCKNVARCVSCVSCINCCNKNYDKEFNFNFFKIADSIISGKGLFARKSFECNEFICQYAGIVTLDDSENRYF
jgi:hypothetical protein